MVAPDGRRGLAERKLDLGVGEGGRFQLSEASDHLPALANRVGEGRDGKEARVVPGGCDTAGDRDNAASGRIVEIHPLGSEADDLKGLERPGQIPGLTKVLGDLGQAPDGVGS